VVLIDIVTCGLRALDVPCAGEARHVWAMGTFGGRLLARKPTLVVASVENGRRGGDARVRLGGARTMC